MTALAKANQNSTTVRRRSVHHRLGGQWPDHGDGVQGRRQQPVVAVVGRGRYHCQRDPARLDRGRALEALFAAVDRAGAGDLAAAGCLGRAAVHRQLLQLCANGLDQQEEVR
jgi:hypothetical protein